MKICYFKKVTRIPHPLTCFVTDDKMIYVFNTAGQIIKYNLDFSYITMNSIDQKIRAAVFTDLNNIACISEEGVFILNKNNFKINKIFDKATISVASNKFENYKGIKFYFSTKDDFVYEFKENEAKIIYRGIKIGSILKEKKKLIIGEKNRIIVLEKEKKKEIVIDGHVVSMSKIDKLTLVCTTEEGNAFIVDINNGIVKQKIEIRTSKVFCGVLDGRLYFSGQDSRMLYYIFYGDKFVKGLQADTHTSSVTCIGLANKKIISIGNDSLIAEYRIGEENLDYKKFYPAFEVAKKWRNKIAVNNGDSLGIYKLENKIVETENFESDNFFTKEIKDMICPKSFKNSFEIKICSKEEILDFSFSDNFLAMRTKIGVKIYAWIDKYFVFREELKDVLQCILFGDYCASLKGNSLILLNLMDQTQKEIILDENEKIYRFGKGIILAKSKRIISDTLEESILKFDFSISNVFCSGKSIFIISRRISNNDFVLTCWDEDGETIKYKKYIKAIHEIRGVVEYKEGVIFYSSNALFYFDPKKNEKFKKEYIGELIYGVEIVDDLLVLIHDDWKYVRKNYEFITGKNKYKQK